MTTAGVLSAATLARVRRASTATPITQLFKRGPRKRGKR